MNRQASTPIVVAHRGLHDRYPENSLDAFAAAWAAGITWCECDVHASADGEPVVLHDDTLDRTTTDHGPVRLQPWSALRHLYLRDANRAITRSRLPHLHDLLNIMPSNCWLLIELKPSNDLALVRRVLDLAPSRRVVLQSFDPENLRHALMIEPAAPVALLLDSPDALDFALDGPWRAIHLQHRLANPQVIARLAAAGKSWSAWTVNDAADLPPLLRLHPRLLITDRPADLRSAIATLQNL